MPSTLVFADDGKNGLSGPAPSSFHRGRRRGRVDDAVRPAPFGLRRAADERRGDRGQQCTTARPARKAPIAASLPSRALPAVPTHLAPPTRCPLRDVRLAPRTSPAAGSSPGRRLSTRRVGPARSRNSATGARPAGRRRPPSPQRGPRGSDAGRAWRRPPSRRAPSRSTDRAHAKALPRRAVAGVQRRRSRARRGDAPRGPCRAPDGARRSRSTRARRSAGRRGMPS